VCFLFARVNLWRTVFGDYFYFPSDSIEIGLLMFTNSQFVGLLAVLCMYVGCSGTPAGQRPTAPVEVTVTYKGSPVSGATVTFITAEEPKAATGITNASGVATLTTYQAGDGAILGSNLVTVTKMEVDPKAEKPLKDPSQADVVGFTPLSPLKSLLPQKYSMPGTSGIEETVVKGKNSFKIELID
jgi:hypothetical protein